MMQVKDFYNNPIIVDNFTWSVSDDLGSSLWEASYPNFLFSLDNLHTQLFKTYAYLRPTGVLRFYINTTSFHAGKLLVWFDPFKQYGSTGNPLVDDTKRTSLQYSLYSYTGNPNAKLDAGYNNTCEILIPFEHLQSFITTNTNDPVNSMGKIYVHVLNELNVNTGTTPSLEVFVQFYFTDCESHVPIFPHTPVGVVEAQMESITSTANQIAGTSKAVSGAAKSVSGAVADVSAAVTDSLSAISPVLGMLSLDKPALTTNFSSVRTATNSTLSHMKGVDSTQRLGPTCDSMYIPRFSLTCMAEREMQLETIMTTPMLCNQLNWSISDSMNTILWQSYVHPGMGKNWKIESSSTFNYSIINPTFLGYLMFMHKQWAMGIVLTLEVTATMHHVGRLLIAFTPNAVDESQVPVTFNHQTSGPHMIMDIAESRSEDFTIPYVSSTPRKKFFDFWQPTFTPDPPTDNHVLGTVVLSVLNPLAVMQSVSPSVAINVYIKAAKGGRFFVPVGNDEFQLYADFVPPSSARIIEAQSDSLMEDRTNAQEDTSHSLTHKGNQVSEDPYGEDILDVRDLCRRYYLLDHNQLGISKNMASTFTPYAGQWFGELYFNAHPARMFIYQAVPLPNNVNRFSNLLCALSQLFVLYSGSLRYKFIPMFSKNQSALIRVTNVVQDPNFKRSGFIRPINDITSYSGYPQTITQQSGLGTVEFEIPYYSEYNQLLTCSSGFSPGVVGDTEFYESADVYIRINSTTDVDYTDVDSIKYVPYQLYISAGEDFRFSYLVSPPPLIHPIMNTTFIKRQG